MTLRHSFLLSLTLASTLLAQKKPITLETLKQRSMGDAPLGTLWAPDGYHFAYTKNGALHLYDCRAKSTRLIFPKISDLTALAVKDSNPDAAFAWQNRRVSEQRIQWAPDSSALLLSEGGDLFWVTVEKSESKQLTKTEVTESDPKLSPDGKKVSYRIHNDLYVQDIASGKVTRLTRDGSETLLNAKLDWVYPEELADVLDRLLA